MLRAIVFDFDGTLVDSNAIKRRGFFDAVRAHARGPELMAQVLGSVAGDRHALFAAYVDARTPSQAAADAASQAEALAGAYTQAVDAAVAAAPEMPGASELLRLTQTLGIPAYLSSATPQASLDHIVARRGWQPGFAGIFGHPLTKTTTLRRLVEAHGGRADALAVVGDGADDAASARAVGCSFWAVGEARGAASDERVHSLADVGEMLRRLLLPRAAALSA